MLAAGGLSLLRKSDDAPNPQASATPSTVASPVASPTPLATTAVEPTPAVASANPKPYRRPPRPRIKGGLKAHLFSTSLEGDSMSSFAADTKTIYLTLTPVGIPERVAMVAAHRSALVEDADFSAPVSSTGSARRRIFKFERPAKGWIPGPYQVMLKSARGKSVFGHLRFEILRPNQKPAKAYPIPEYLDLSEELKSAKRSTFTTASPKIYLRVATYKIPEGTTVRTIWSAVEVKRLDTGELVAVSDRSAPSADKDCIFVYSPPPGGFLKGAYKVDVYFEDQKVGSQAFFVQRPVPVVESSQ